MLVPLFVASRPAVCLFSIFVPLNVVVGSTVLSACLLNKSAPLIAGQSVTVSGEKIRKNMLSFSLYSLDNHCVQYNNLFPSKPLRVI